MSIQNLVDPESYQMITDANSLNEVCESWAASSFLALDTEFIRTSTFYPKVGLIQVCDGQQNYLIDPLQIESWDSFKALMTNPDITKIFHSCSEDILVFLAFLGVVPAPIFDTQIANALLNQGFALSYQNMVKAQVDIDLPKGETRSDWLQRPLTASQLKYAALDVAYLPQIFMEQTKQLQQQGKLTWLEEECERLIASYGNEQNNDFGQYYLNLKSAWQLDQSSLAALQVLAQWRELRARERDKPRTWIVKDKPLLAIAKALPQTEQELGFIPELSTNFIHFEGKHILQIVAKVKNIPAGELPDILPRPLSNAQKGKLKKAQAFGEQQAQLLSVPTEILARKRSLMALYNNIIQLQKQDNNTVIDVTKLTIPDELLGWRKNPLLASFLEILQ